MLRLSKHGRNGLPACRFVPLEPMEAMVAAFNHEGCAVAVAPAAGALQYFSYSIEVNLP
jgi:hypothetical protein